ncbi:MAG: L,D-transpeptidase [Chloroflexota bacterium]|nr:L,D-transpeptidase [Chloroflexota bacterium]
MVALLSLALLVALGLPVAANANPVDPDWAPPPTVYIPETGQTVDRLILDLWRGSGGAATFGYPITPELPGSAGQVVQYYEYARFEYWPEGNEAGNFVTLGVIGYEIAPLQLPRRCGPQETAGGRDRTALARAWLPLDQAAADIRLGDEPSYRYVPATRHGVWGGFRAFWEATGEAAYLGNPISEEYIVAGTSFQVFERGNLRWRPGEAVALVPIGQMLVERYQLSTDPQPQGNIPAYDENLFVPPIVAPSLVLAPPAPTMGRAVVVSLSQQALWAYADGEVVRSTFVSTGTEKFRTPTGRYPVIRKIEIEDMQGVIGDESYFVPDVPHVLYFTDRGHALHGTYWHSNFGVPMSHGCINLPLDVAACMYEWAPMGMTVQIIE